MVLKASVQRDGLVLPHGGHEGDGREVGGSEAALYAPCACWLGQSQPVWSLDPRVWASLEAMPTGAESGHPSFQKLATALGLPWASVGGTEEDWHSELAVGSEPIGAAGALGSSRAYAGKGGLGGP